MKQCTLVLIFNNKSQILLCMKKRDFWVWKYNGAWWKVKQDETIIDAAKRELEEETWIKIKDDKLEKRWLLHFEWIKNPDWNQDVHLFTVKDFNWNFIETEEMKPEWFNIKNIPYDKMWEDDKIWLPEILKWKNIEYIFSFGEDWKILKFKKIL